MLNQSIASGFAIGSSRTVLHSITRSPALHFVTRDDFRRWIFPRELLLALGFPILPRLANPRGGRNHKCTSFVVPRPRSRVEVMNAAGNAMQVVVVGSVWFYLLFSSQSVLFKVRLGRLRVRTPTKSRDSKIFLLSSSFRATWKSEPLTPGLLFRFLGFLVFARVSIHERSMPARAFSGTV